MSEMNIGTFARKCIVENPTMKNGEILALVKAQFPKAETKEASIAWYRSKLKQNPVTIKRDMSTVENEIVQVKLKLASLEEELAQMAEQDEQELLEQQEELEAKLAKIKELKAAKEEAKQE